MRVGDDRAELVERVVQIVHPLALPRVDVQTHAFALPGGLRFRRAVQSGRAGSANPGRSIQKVSEERKYFGGFEYSVIKCSGTSRGRACSHRTGRWKKHVVAVAAENRSHQGRRHPGESSFQVHFEGVPTSNQLEGRKRSDARLPAPSTWTLVTLWTVAVAGAAKVHYIDLSVCIR